MRAQVRTSRPGAGGSQPAGRRRSRARMASLAAVLALGVLTGCASAPDPDLAPEGGGLATDGVGRPGPPASEDPAAALARWQSFPVSADPRPMVLIGGMVLDPTSGFTTDADKQAYLAGQFELGAALPTAPPTVDGHTVIPAQAALDRLGENASGQQAGTRLRIVKVKLTRAKFYTDRGPRLLPAWQFSLAGVADGVEVLAVAQSQVWPAAQLESTWLQEEASVAADGRTLTYVFYASPGGPSPCGVDYAGRLAESRAAVVISVAEAPRASLSSGSTGQACPALAVKRTVTVRLAEPLGNRVLLNPRAAPVAVVTR